MYRNHGRRKDVQPFFFGSSIVMSVCVPDSVEDLEEHEKFMDVVTKNMA